MCYGEVLVDKSVIGLILRVLGYIVTISFWSILYCVCIICTVVVLNCFVMRVCVCVCVCVYGCVWVCVCGGFVMCGCVYVWIF